MSDKSSRKPTIQDLARKAGVGAGTVSRVLNNHPSVSEETRARVQRAMEDLEYRPSYAARHLRTQRSRLIGLISHQVATLPYAGDIIQGAQEAAREAGCLMMIVDAGNDLKATSAVVEELLEREVEGIIFAAVYHQEVVLPDNLREVPAVLANCFVGDHSLPAYVPDEYTGGFEATRELCAAGHRRIGFFNVNRVDPGVPASRGRLAGYRAALEQAGLAFDPELVHNWGHGDTENGYRMMSEVLGRPNRPTAVFCGNDRLAMGAYQALAEQGLSVPRDMSIIGFDNQMIIADALRPGLSSMQLPHREMGRLAMEVLVGAEAGTAPGNGLSLVACPLVARQSIGAPPSR